MDSCENTIQGIGPQIFRAQAHYSLYIVSLFYKQRDDPGSQRLAQDKNDCPESHTDLTSHLQNPAASVMPPCTRILGGESGNRGEHGAGHKEEETDDLLHDADCSGHLYAPAE